MIYSMSYLFYVWRIYRIIMITHGVYVAISFIFWILGETKNTFIWIVSWFPKPLSQIEDKKYKEEEAENDFTLLTQS